MEYISFSEEDTENIAGGFAEKINAVFCLRGELGAGKTAFARGFASAAGYKGTVGSPTFEIIHEYCGGKFDVFHFDFYRVKSAEEAYETGFEEYLYKEGVCLIEWPEVILPLLSGLPEDVKIFDVEFKKIFEGNAEKRVITVNEKKV